MTTEIPKYFGILLNLGPFTATSLSAEGCGYRAGSGEGRVAHIALPYCGFVHNCVYLDCDCLLFTAWTENGTDLHVILVLFKVISSRLSTSLRIVVSIYKMDSVGLGK